MLNTCVRELCALCALSALCGLLPQTPGGDGRQRTHLLLSLILAEKVLSLLAGLSA